jgi:hypothetical protein
LRHLDALPLSLVPRDEKGVDFLTSEVVIVPVKSILEPPVAAFTHSAHGYRHTLLALSHRLELVLGNLVESVGIPPDLKSQPTAAREHPGLVANGHVLSPAQHRSRLPAAIRPI